MRFFKFFFIIIIFLASFVAFNARSQTLVVSKSSVLVLSQDDLFKKSAPGQALLKVFKKKQSKLFSEASEIEKK